MKQAQGGEPEFPLCALYRSIEICALFSWRLLSSTETCSRQELNQKKTAVTEGQAENFPLPPAGSKKVRAYQRTFFEGLTDRSDSGGRSSPRKGKLVRLSNIRTPRGFY